MGVRPTWNPRRLCLPAAVLLAATVGAGCRPADPAAGPAAGEPDPAAPAVAQEGLDAAGATASTAPAPGPIPADLAPLYDLVVAQRTGAARVRLRKRLDRSPGDAHALFLFGLSYHREKRYALARPYFERALARAPGYADAHYFYGWCLYYLGEAERARAAFEIHLRHEPDEGDSHFALGLIEMDEDRVDEAERRFRRAIELQEDRPDRVREVAKAHALLADVHVRRGAFAEARKELERATTMYPDHYAAHYRLYRVCLRQGDAAAAERARREFLASRRRVQPETRFPE